MNEKKLRLALVGKDVSASTSHKVHAFILGKFGYGCEYEKISIPAQEFDTTVRRLLGDFDGFSVTIPYKRDIMEYLEEIVGDAFDFGAVNTVVSATRKGYNTDGAGFMLMLRLAGVEVKGKKALVLGGGGAGRSTAAALKKGGAEVFLYQRNREKLEETCRELQITPASSANSGGYDMLINATGVGMHDKEGLSPVEVEAFEGASAAIDLIYHPAESAFLTQAKGLGLQILNGAPMLFYQAYFADCLFLNETPTDDEAQAFYIEYQKETNGGRL